ncbi:hypothetical protein C8R46DRAFT_993795 [Mycena filopes]|nr:hypothetical protein C8R46DRAFT_993795 [Mycena filopes]
MSFRFVAHGPQPLSACDSDSGVPPPLAWSQYTPEEASGRKTLAMNQRTFASKIHLDHLQISTEQFEQIEQLYRRDATAAHGAVDLIYSTSDDDQLAASAIMAQQELDLDTREQRWLKQWGRDSARSEKYISKSRRELYLCRCGYKHPRNSRQTPVPFTSCLAHVEITYTLDKHNILRIRGYFHHNEACKAAGYTRIPSIPDHPSVSPLGEGRSILEVVSVPSQHASTNLAALRVGEQALARTICELEEVLEDLAEFTKEKSGPLSSTEREALSRGRGYLAAILTQFDRLLLLSPPTQLSSQLTCQVPEATQGPSGSQRAKNTHLLPPSPEKRSSKRHNSQTPH